MAILNTITQVVPLTQFQRDTKRLYDTLYRAILARVTGGSAGDGYRFPTAKEANAEAWECARLHAGLLPRNNVFRIVDDPVNDPWKQWRGNPNDSNPEIKKKSSVSTYVIKTQTNEVYDHRTRYAIKEPWAFRLGFLNPIFTWDAMGAPEVNPYAGKKNPGADKYYDAKGVVKNRSAYVPNV